jgi:hypothetical protein
MNTIRIFAAFFLLVCGVAQAQQGSGYTPPPLPTGTPGDAAWFNSAGQLGDAGPPPVKGVIQRQGVINSPTLPYEMGSAGGLVAEATILAPDTSCNLVPAQFTSCWHLIGTAGPGTPSLEYLESTDGIHWPYKAAATIATGYRSSSVTLNTATCSACTISGSTLTVAGTVTGQWTNGQYINGTGITSNTYYITARVSGTGAGGTYTLSGSPGVSGPLAVTGTAYYLLAANTGWTQIDLLSSANAYGNYSVLKSAFITPGGGATWDATNVTNTSMIFVGGTAYIFMEGYQNSVGGIGGIGLFTSTDMSTVSQPVSNPVISSAGGGGTVGNAAIGGPTSPYFTNGLWYIGAHATTTNGTLGTSGAVPEDIYLFSAPTLNATAWTPVKTTPFFARLTSDEGVNTGVGQIADPWWVEVGGKIYFSYSAASNATSVSTGGFVTKLAVMDMTLAQFFASAGGSNVGSLAISDGVPSSGQITFTGAGTYYWPPPIGSVFTVAARGQGGCGGGGPSLTGGVSGSGGGGGGGGGVKLTPAPIPASMTSGVASITINAPCTAAAGANGSVGGTAFFGITGLDNNMIAYAGGGGAGGAAALASGGGGGAGNIGSGGSSTGAAGGGGANFNGGAGGTGVGGSNATGPMGASGGGGSSAVGAAGGGASSVSASTGGGAGGGCTTGTPQAGGSAVSSVNGITTTAGSAGGATGGNGATGWAAAGWGGGGGSGAGAGTTQGGTGGNGGVGGGGAGGGGAGCGGTGGPGGVGGAAEVTITWWTPK